MKTPGFFAEKSLLRNNSIFSQTYTKSSMNDITPSVMSPRPRFEQGPGSDCDCACVSTCCADDPIGRQSVCWCCEYQCDCSGPLS